MTLNKVSELSKSQPPQLYSDANIKVKTANTYLTTSDIKTEINILS